MKWMKRWYVRMTAFFLGFLLLNSCVEMVFLNVNPHNLITMTDYEQTESAEVYFIGSSWFRNQVNSTIITEESGMSAFTMAAENVMIPAQKALMEQMFKEHNPKYVVVDYDLLNYGEYVIEPALVQACLWSFLDFDVRVRSVLESAPIDDGWLDRTFPWRYYHATSLRNMGGNVAKKLVPQRFRDEFIRQWASTEVAQPVHYTGRGHFGAVYTDYDAKVEKRFASFHKTAVASPLNQQDAQGLLELKALCAENGAQLIIAIPPVHRAVSLTYEGYFRGDEAMAAFCEDNEIPYWNFMFIRNEVMEPMDHTFYDGNHIDMEGAAVFSSALAQVLQRHDSGEDISRLFYTPAEYLESMPFVLNTYYTEAAADRKVTFTAYVNAGSNVVPLYQYALADEQGNEEVIRPYSPEPQLTLEAGKTEGKSVVLYAINEAQPQQKAVRYTK